MNAQTQSARRGKPDLPTRRLTLVASRTLHPGLRRLSFSCEDGLPEYLPGQDLVFLLPLGEGETGRRHYTIRGADPAAGTLDVDIVMHGATPGPEFAKSALPGETVRVRGPRGRTFLREAASHHLFLGDETALPAILHMIEALPPGTSARAVLEVADAAWEMPVTTAGDVTVEWIHRHGPPAPSALLPERLDGIALPEGTVAYTLAETSVVRALRRRLLERGLGKEAIVAEGYWRPGREGGHDHVRD